MDDSILIKNAILLKGKADIFIREGKIEKIASFINKRARERIDCRGEKMVLPGLINSHVHAAMTLFRGMGDDLPLKQWLEQKIWSMEKKLNPDDVYWGTKLACLEMIKTGTTCFNDMYWFQGAGLEAIKEMGLRAIIGLTILDFIPWGRIEMVEKNWEQFKKMKLETIKFSLAPHSIYTVSKENLIWAEKFALKNNLLIHIHLSETEKDVKNCLSENKLRPVEYLDKIGLLNEKCSLAHSIWLANKEIKILTERKCSVVYNPNSNMKLASGIFPWSKLRKAKINICLGTDGPASNNSLDMFREMKAGALLPKVAELNPTIASAEEIFNTATKNAGRAFKIKIGEIKEGFFADLILINLNQICFTPGHNLISDLVYSGSGASVSDVICHGRILMRERRVESEKEIIKKVKNYGMPERQKS